MRRAAQRGLTLLEVLVSIGILALIGTLVGGLILLLASVNQWRLTDFGNLDYPHTMRWVIPGVTLTFLGFQTVLNSFFGSILGMRRK